MGSFVALFCIRTTFLCAIAGSGNADIGYSYSIRSQLTFCFLLTSLNQVYKAFEVHKQLIFISKVPNSNWRGICQNRCYMDYKQS